VLFVVLLAVAFLIVHTPNTNKSPQDILDYYLKNSHKHALGAATIIADTAVLFAVFWFGYLHDRFGRTDEGARFAPIMLTGTAIFATGGLIFNGTQFALIDSPKHMSADTAQTLNFLQSDIGFPAILIGTSVVMFAAGIIIYKTAVLPVWMAYFSFVIAVVALIGPFGFFAFLAMGIWILIAAFFMWRFEAELPVS
jgi:hypothetical protein